MAPAKIRATLVARRSNKVERRCLSFREARISSDEGDGAISSSGTKGAEQNCTASLKNDMVPLRAFHVAHENEEKRGVMA